MMRWPTLLYMKPFISAVALVASLATATGCLSSTHRIYRGELMALAQTPPGQRGNHVRVVQNLGGQQEPPPAARVDGNTTVILVGDVHTSGTTSSHEGHRPGGGYG